MGRIAVTAPLLLALLAGCAAEKPKAPTRAQVEHQAYVGKVSAVCVKYDRLADAITLPGEDASVDEYRAFLRKAIGWADAFRREVRAVRPPAAQRAEVVERLWGPMDELAKGLRDVSSGIDRAMRTHSEDDVQGIENDLKEWGDSLVGSAGWMDDFGLSSCAIDV